MFEFFKKLKEVPKENTVYSRVYTPEEEAKYEQIIKFKDEVLTPLYNKVRFYEIIILDSKIIPGAKYKITMGKYNYEEYFKLNILYTTYSREVNFHGPYFWGLAFITNSYSTEDFYDLYQNDKYVKDAIDTIINTEL